MIYINGSFQLRGNCRCSIRHALWSSSKNWKNYQNDTLTLVNATNEAAYWRENIRFPNVSNIGYINKYRSRQHLVLLMALDISCSDDVMDFLGAQLESFLFFTNTMAIQSKTYEQRFTQWAVKLRDVKTKAEVANVVSATLISLLWSV